MREFTLEEYRTMSKKFKELTFYYQIKGLQKHQDLFKICADNNWWGVKVKDEEIQKQLEELGETFEFENMQWGYKEMETLLAMIGFGVYDL